MSGANGVEGTLAAIVAAEVLGCSRLASTAGIPE
jgi:hypothetical protein